MFTSFSFFTSPPYQPLGCPLIGDLLFASATGLQNAIDFDLACPTTVQLYGHEMLVVPLTELKTIRHPIYCIYAATTSLPC